MATCIAILTPKWTVHVSDAHGDTPRTSVWRRGRWRGLVTAVRDGDPGEFLSFVGDVARARPNADAQALAIAVAERAPLGIPEGDSTLLMTGFGLDGEGREVDFQWCITDFEDPEPEGTARFSVVGRDLVPSPSRPGSRGGAAAATSFSVTVSTTDQPGPAFERALESLPKKLRRGGAQEAALAAVAALRTLYSGPVTLMLLEQDGALEGGVLTDRGLTPLTADSGDGWFALRR
jgi:hypothetical protein